MCMIRLSDWGGFLGPLPLWGEQNACLWFTYQGPFREVHVPPHGCQGALQEQLLGPLGCRRVEGADLQLLCSKACSGKQRGRYVGSLRRAWNTERHWLSQRCFSFSAGDRAGSFLGWLCAAEGWTVQPTLNQRHCVQMNKCTLFWDAAIVFGVGGRRGVYFVCVCARGSVCFQKVSADCNSCWSVFVCQTGPFSWERGMWWIPAQDYINQSIISPGMRSTNDSKS